MLSRRLVYALALNLIVGAATSAGALADEAPANRTYAMSVLNLPTNSYSSAAAIDNAGKIVGQSGNGAVLVKAAVTDLPTPANRVTSWALGLNEHNEVVGGANDAQGATHAVVWRNKKATELAPLPGTTQALAQAVNEGGTIVGYSVLADGNHHAVAWEGRGPTDLSVLPGDNQSEAYGINDRGEIVGHSWDSHALLSDHAVVWRNGAISALPSLGGGESRAYGINSAGKIVGQANGHAVLWHQGRVTDLGAPAGSSRSWAKAINDRGAVVGGAYGPDGFSPEAVVFSHGTTTVLGVNPGTQSDAYAINNHGEVAGYSSDTSGPLSHAVVWKPSRS